MDDDFDLEQAASMLVQQHGDDAAQYAAQWATALIEAGNGQDARKFVRIVRAIRRLTRSRKRLRLRSRPRAGRRHAG